ncbi:MAG TPA: flagellar basal body P-ring protein FlgI [Tepidisphaeraceae bacterium]|nr:flagellar basal body P-ring protein FlgI [Tepidisphaeraceae bacterium]
MRRNISILLFAVCVLGTAPAFAVKIADVTRLSGQRTNLLTGLGLMYGLKGTGDGGDYAAAIRPLASMLGKFSDPVTVTELSKTQNVAIVELTATIPSTGAREGDHIDVRIASVGSATTLKGGRLFVCPMMGPMAGSGIFALAEGPIDLEDPSTPNVGVVHGGAVMEEDMRVSYVDKGRFGLIIEAPTASWTAAHMIAKTINGAESLNGEDVAQAVDAKEVIVQIPAAERDHPDSFISRVQQLPLLMLPAEARVTINKKTGTLIVTGDVEISPVVISHKGLTIDTIVPPPVPTPRTPVVTSRQSIAIDTVNQGGARLQDLVNALEQLRVPVEDRITIVEELYRTGKLHAKLIEESN